MERSASKLQHARLRALVNFKQAFFQQKRPAVFKRRRLKYENYLLQSLETAGFQSSEILKLSTMVDLDSLFVEHLKRLIKRQGV